MNSIELSHKLYNNNHKIVSSMQSKSNSRVSFDHCCADRDINVNGERMKSSHLIKIAIVQWNAKKEKQKNNQKKT